MSLPKDPIEPVPKETVRIAQAAFPKGNIYMKMRDELGSIYDNAQFSDLFPRRHPVHAGRLNYLRNCTPLQWIVSHSAAWSANCDDRVAGAPCPRHCSPAPSRSCAEADGSRI